MQCPFCNGKIVPPDKNNPAFTCNDCQLDFILARFEGKHCGDPCIYCNTPHDDVAIGNCMGKKPQRRGLFITL